MPEPTSALTFADLILEVARKMGVATYGVAGDEALQIPTDAHDLAECQRHVNSGIRMFINDGPRPAGWRWLMPTGSITLWGDVVSGSTNIITSAVYDAGADTTLITVTSDAFFESMEEKSIAFTDITSPATFTITQFVSATQLRVSGDASAADGASGEWSITSDGNYTLPRDFGGTFLGAVTYTSNTNQGVSIQWQSEATIRNWREDISDETGDPFWAAIRPKSVVVGGRRRWELMAYPQADEVLVLEFPYLLHFDKLVNNTEVQPAPFLHDETVRAACLAAVEKDAEDGYGPDWDYYRNSCLPNSYRIDAMAAPKKLGYFGNPSGITAGQAIHQFRQHGYQRPVVPFNQ